MTTKPRTLHPVEDSDLADSPPIDTDELAPLEVSDAPEPEEAIEVAEMREWKAMLRTALLKMRLERRSARAQLDLTDRLLGLANVQGGLRATRVTGIINSDGRNVDTGGSLKQELKQRRLKLLFQEQELEESIALHTAELARCGGEG